MEFPDFPQSMTSEENNLSNSFASTEQPSERNLNPTDPTCVKAVKYDHDIKN